MFKEIWYALKVEIKNVILKSWFHFIRFGGLLIIPLIYGFSYIFAFYDPFPNMDQLNVAVITQDQKTDPFGYALGSSLEKTQVKIGDLHMDLKMEHIYGKDQDAVDKIKNEDFASIQVLNLNTPIVAAIKKLNGAPITLQLVMNTIADVTNKIPSIQINANYKKNYLTAFGVTIGTAMSGSYVTAIREASEAFEDPLFLQQFQGDPPTIANIHAFVATIKDTFNDKNLEENSPVALHSNMGGEHAKYGYGLAPFFISVAMWIGGMVMTFAVHRKIYDTKVTPGHRYFAKWILIAFGTIMQATILMISLYIIGFKQLGISHWGSMYGFAIIIGLVFSANIQAIRFIIHSRNLGIFLTIILLVLQMASGGGLFPVETQSGFYHVLNAILPMSKGINIIRETSFDTDWGELWTQLGYLLIYLLIVPIGVVINHYRVIGYYMDKNIELPPKTLKHWDERMKRRQARVKVIKNTKLSKHIKKRRGGGK